MGLANTLTHSPALEQCPSRGPVPAPESLALQERRGWKTRLTCQAYLGAGVQGCRLWKRKVPERWGLTRCWPGCCQGGLGFRVTLQPAAPRDSA